MDCNINTEVKDSEDSSKFLTSFDKSSCEDLEIEYDEIIPESVFKFSCQEPFICIELENNNKIYLKYKEHWLIKDVRNFI